MKKKVIIWGYFTKNLGDDLMLKAFVNKFKKEYDIFYILSYKKYKNFYSDLGVKVIECDSFIYKVINKFFTLFNLPELYYRFSIKKNVDFVMLGGSLFAEVTFAASKNQIKNLKYAVEHAKNSYVIGSNFGPYNSKEFYYKYKEIFKKCKDVCFRDKYSYSLFQDIKTIRYAPDIILSGEWDIELYKTNKCDNVVLSIINLKKRPDLSIQTNKYEQLLADIATYHISRGDKVILASFCEYEEDLEACLRIKKLCDGNVDICSYRDFNFLKIFSNAKKVYGTRFHSIILSMYYDIPCVPFIYNEKTYNALFAYCQNFKVIDIKKISEYSTNDIINNNNTIKLIPNIRSLAKNQFERE